MLLCFHVQCHTQKPFRSFYLQEKGSSCNFWLQETATYSSFLSQEIEPSFLYSHLGIGFFWLFFPQSSDLLHHCSHVGNYCFLISWHQRVDSVCSYNPRLEGSSSPVERVMFPFFFWSGESLSSFSYQEIGSCYLFYYEEEGMLPFSSHSEGTFFFCLQWIQPFLPLSFQEKETHCAFWSQKRAIFSPSFQLEMMNASSTQYQGSFSSWDFETQEMESYPYLSSVAQGMETLT